MENQTSHEPANDNFSASLKICEVMAEDIKKYEETYFDLMSNVNFSNEKAVYAAIQKNIIESNKRIAMNAIMELGR